MANSQNNKKKRDLFYQKRKALLQRWRKGNGSYEESASDQQNWINKTKEKIFPIDVGMFLDRLKAKTSQEGILDLCIDFFEKHNLDNPLLYAPSLEGFQTRKDYLSNLMEQLINPSTQENN